MKTLLIVLLSLIPLSLMCNINFIEFNKIKGSDKYRKEINFLLKYEKYFNHWQLKWDYHINKNVLTDKLKKSFRNFSKLNKRNLENCLLLGDIAHYLYNLDETKYFEIARKFYKKAIRTAPKDYRGYWFLANHYSLSIYPVLAMEYYQKSQKLKPKNKPAKFWEQYAYAAYWVCMPSHSIYAFEQEKQILTYNFNTKNSLYQSVQNLIIPTNRDSSYKYEDIWEITETNDTFSFVSRALGMKFELDGDWGLDLFDYANNLAIVSITPPPITNKMGVEIKYTINIFIQVIVKGNQFDYLENFVQNDKSKYKKSNFPKKYKNMVCYDIRNKSIYKDIGGAHMLLLEFKRKKPKYPGILLEEPYDFKKNIKNGNTAIFVKPTPVQDRFDDIIQYVILLDTCEDIYKESLKLFRQFYQNHLIIE